MSEKVFPLEAHDRIPSYHNSSVMRTQYSVVPTSLYQKLVCTQYAYLTKSGNRETGHLLSGETFGLLLQILPAIYMLTSDN